MRSAVAAVLAAAVVAVAACGDDESPPAEAGQAAPPGTTTETEAATGTTAERARTRGTRIVLRDSEFGPMLFDARRQAIYVYEHDTRDRTACFGECARAWPPVYTRGRPRAGEGVDADLLGTIRRGGRRQVTYRGRPLYFYADERPGEVRCHNVDLHGGFWWVIGPDGRRRP